MDEKKTIDLKVEELEERIAPIVDPFVTALGVTLPGEGGGGQAGPHVFGTEPIDGPPVMQNTPGVGPA